MILKENDFRIEEDGIWISKKALEEVRDYYREVCKGHAKSEVLDWSAGVDHGKRDILNDILKCFNENLIVTNKDVEGMQAVGKDMTIETEYTFEQIAANLTGKSLLLQHRSVTGDLDYEEKYLSLNLFRVHPKRATYYHTVKGAGTSFMMELKKEMIEALTTFGTWEGSTYRKGVVTKIMIIQ